MTEPEGFAAYVGCVFGNCSMKVEASVNYSASGDLDRSEHNSRFNPARRGSTAWFDCAVQLRGPTSWSNRGFRKFECTPSCRLQWAGHCISKSLLTVKGWIF